MTDELDRAVIAKAYARWAPVYDFVFGAVFDRGRKASVAAAERTGGRILEVGVGTGLSLPEPQSQKVHWKGQPRFVSHSTIQVSSGCASMSGAKVPPR